MLARKMINPQKSDDFIHSQYAMPHERFISQKLLSLYCQSYPLKHSTSDFNIIQASGSQPFPSASNFFFVFVFNFLISIAPQKLVSSHPKYNSHQASKQFHVTSTTSINSAIKLLRETTWKILCFQEHSQRKIHLSVECLIYLRNLNEIF